MSIARSCNQCHLINPAASSNMTSMRRPPGLYTLFSTMTLPLLVCFGARDPTHQSFMIGQLHDSACMLATRCWRVRILGCMRSLQCATAPRPALPHIRRLRCHLADAVTIRCMRQNSAMAPSPHHCAGRAELIYQVICSACVFVRLAGMLM